MQLLMTKFETKDDSAFVTMTRDMNEIVIEFPFAPGEGLIAELIDPISQPSLIDKQNVRFKIHGAIYTLNRVPPDKINRFLAKDQLTRLFGESDAARVTLSSLKNQVSLDITTIEEPEESLELQALKTEAICQLMGV